MGRTKGGGVTLPTRGLLDAVVDYLDAKDRYEYWFKKSGPDSVGSLFVHGQLEYAETQLRTVASRLSDETAPTCRQ